MLNEPLTQKEYLENPNHCPKCGGENIIGNEVTIESGAAFQFVGCNDCDATWTDVYVLSRYVLD